jgi:hypothetical protein
VTPLLSHRGTIPSHSYTPPAFPRPSDKTLQKTQNRTPEHSAWFNNAVREKRNRGGEEEVRREGEAGEESGAETREGMDSMQRSGVSVWSRSPPEEEEEEELIGALVSTDPLPSRLPSR